MWTKMQEKAINAKGNNLLVSAAAGSGKTAVLVERIASLIIEQGVSVDELVVVTFTRAAAAEMKDRIRRKLEERLEENPDNQRLADQITLISKAMISTIDSFCLEIIRENFLEAGIDPSVRTADKSEIGLMENEILAEVIEKKYMLGDTAFIQAAQSISPGKNDKNIEAVIMKLYSEAKSFPWPMKWLDKQLEAYQELDENALEKLPVVSAFEHHVKSLVGDYVEKYDYIIKLSSNDDGPKVYLPNLTAERESLDSILKATNITELIDQVNAMGNSFGKLTAAKGVDKDICDIVKKVRDSIKKAIGKLKKANGIKGITEDVANTRGLVEALIDTAKEFYMQVQAKKQEKNIIDFNDMEHITLDLLVVNDNGEIGFTKTADRLAKKYKYIMVDEYQDSNYLQEYILLALCSERFGQPNMFMVGDVKQSIYSFRQAKPQLFVEKYHKYEKNPKAGEKIELQANFRSRADVLEAANAIFFAVMKECVGDVEYTDEVKLNAEGEFAQLPEGKCAGGKCEIMLVDAKETQDDELLDLKLEYDTPALEAAVVARKIIELMKEDSNYVVQLDKKEQKEGGPKYRRVEYRDIAILLRGGSEWFESYAQVLMNAGIPVSVESKEGYFDTLECKWVLDVLSCVDNPYQDIKLAGMLCSYFGGFSFEELAQLRAGRKANYLYENLRTVALQEDNDLSIKAVRVINYLERLKEMTGKVSLYDLLWEIIHNGGYYAYIGQLPAGNKRQANLDAIVLKAKSYENSQMKGLFNFLRYIEQIGKFSVEAGEVGNSFDENSVRILTIHKSKGLEYPIVFIGKTMQNFNFQDLKKPVLIDAELGMGTYTYDLKKRTKKNTFYRDLIGKSITEQIIAEEIRIFYVALTRAKEKLFIVGSDDNLEKKIKDAGIVAEQLLNMDKGFMYADILDCKNYYNMYMPVAANDTEHFSLEIVNWKDLQTFLMGCEAKMEITNVEEVEEEVEAYPYEKYTGIRSKFSVSEIKHMSHASDEEDHEKPASLLGAAKGFENVEGATRGTAYHRVMECIDYKTLSIDDEAELRNQLACQLEAMVSRKLLTKEAADTVEVGDIAKFVQSELGRRIARADSLGMVKREQPFVYGVRAGSLPCYADIAECDEMVLVQGEIDLYFYEGNKVIVVDYKTDKVRPENGRARLMGMYQEQLHQYAGALQRIMGKEYEVAEEIIYSFTLGEYFDVKAKQ